MYIVVNLCFICTSITFILGFDRLMALLCHVDSLRDVIAFPKSFRGKDLFTGAPTEIDKSDLKHYHISLDTDRDKK